MWSTSPPQVRSYELLCLGDYKSTLGSENAIQVVIKSKTTAVETCNMLNKMAQACGQALAIEYPKHKMMIGLKCVNAQPVLG